MTLTPMSEHAESARHGGSPEARWTLPAAQAIYDAPFEEPADRIAMLVTLANLPVPPEERADQSPRADHQYAFVRFSAGRIDRVREPRG